MRSTRGSIRARSPSPVMRFHCSYATPVGVRTPPPREHVQGRGPARHSRSVASMRGVSDPEVLRARGASTARQPRRSLRDTGRRARRRPADAPAALPAPVARPSGMSPNATTYAAALTEAVRGSRAGRDRAVDRYADDCEDEARASGPAGRRSLERRPPAGGLTPVRPCTRPARRTRAGPPTRPCENAAGEPAPLRRRCLGDQEVPGRAGVHPDAARRRTPTTAASTGTTAGSTRAGGARRRRSGGGVARVVDPREEQVVVDRRRRACRAATRARARPRTR